MEVVGQGKIGGLQDYWHGVAKLLCKDTVKLHSSVTQVFGHILVCRDSFKKTMSSAVVTVKVV